MAKPKQKQKSKADKDAETKVALSLFILLFVIGIVVARFTDGWLGSIVAGFIAMFGGLIAGVVTHDAN